MDAVVIAVIISFFGYILYGAAGFGAAMIFHSLWTLLELFHITNGSVKEATYYLNIMTLVVTLAMSINNRALIQWNFIFACVFPWFGMNVLGCYILDYMPNRQLKMVLGVCLLIIFLQQFTKVMYTMISGHMLQEKIIIGAQDKSDKPFDISDVPEVDMCKSWHWLVFVGCIGGILSGVFNMPGPSTIVILLFSGIHRERWKANFFCWQIPAQFYVVWFLSFHVTNEEGQEGLFKQDMWYWYLIMCVVAIAGSKLGNCLGQYLDQTTFTFIVIGLCFMGACSDASIMLRDDEKQWLMLIGTGATIFIFITLLSVFYCYVNKPYQNFKHDILLDTSQTPNEPISVLVDKNDKNLFAGKASGGYHRQSIDSVNSVKKS